MEKEHLILNHIQQQQDATQRGIARETGMGLGTVNFLLKKMAKKGLIKVESIDARSLRYILTPKGLKEKSEKTYNYIKRSYNHVLSVSNQVGEILQSADLQKADIVYLYGPQNEMYEIVKMALQQQKSVHYQYIEEVPDVDTGIVLVWQLEDEKRLAGNLPVVNVLSKL